MISIIIPLYNGKKTIAQAINSILKQTYKDLEIIVIDDGSTDGSADLIPAISIRPDSERAKAGIPIKLIKQKNLGANAARNRGAKEAHGEYLFFCDADIILKPYALERLKKTLDSNAEAAYAYCSFKFGIKKITSQKFDIEILKKYNYISTMSLVRKKDFSGFDEKLQKFQDWDLWLTMAMEGKYGIFVSEVLFKAIPAKNGKSKWLPKIFYKIPWDKFGIKIDALKKYNEALLKIKKKHGLT
ncbi:MAG: glycosyltransferase family A protein [Patescibacteria group bacterium]